MHASVCVCAWAGRCVRGGWGGGGGGGQTVKGEGGGGKRDLNQ